MLKWFTVPFSSGASFVRYRLTGTCPQLLHVAGQQGQHPSCHCWSSLCMKPYSLLGVSQCTAQGLGQRTSRSHHEGGPGKVRADFEIYPRTVYSLASLLPLAPWCCFAASLVLFPTFPLLRLLDVIVQACQAQHRVKGFIKPVLTTTTKGKSFLVSPYSGGDKFQNQSMLQVMLWVSCIRKRNTSASTQLSFLIE